MTKAAPAVLITTGAELERAVARLRGARRIAVDIESNGLFKYRATLCAMQLADDDGAIVVDTLAAPLAPLAELLSAAGPRKIVHDVAFDARIVAESGLELGNVLDTSVAARMLGRMSTGLATLLGTELGIKLDKKLQHHDWTERPLRPMHLHYLAEDVVHLGALADKLGAEVDERGIGDAIEEETRYRIAQATAAARTVDPRPPYVRLKGIDRVPVAELPILRRLADIRERKAKDLDVPPYKVLGPDVLFAIARAKPTTLDDLAKVKGAANGSRARALGVALVGAVAAGIADEGIPENEQEMLTPKRLPSSIAKLRRAREGRLTAWRKSAAKERGVDEQVILPGHCLQDLADLDDATLEEIARVPGIGAFRVERDGAAIAGALAPPPKEEGA